jgi:hypothetical protein
MQDNQQVLADSFSGFINGFVREGLDFHVGIVTSDVDSSRASVWRSRMPDYPGANRGLLLSRFSSDRFLTGNTSGLVSKFQSNAMVGTSGSSREQCLNSFIYAMEDPVDGSGGWNHDFFRNDSLLSFVVISDENEDIQEGETIQSRVQRLKDRIKARSSAFSRGSRFDFVINTSVAPPAYTPAPGEIQYYPARYLAASKILSGHNYDISRNFSSDLLQISSGMVQQASHEFTLSQLAVSASSMVVTLNGQLVASDSVNGYVYHTDRNTIELMGDAANAAAGGVLSVTYLI